MVRLEVPNPLAPETPTVPAFNVKPPVKLLLPPVPRFQVPLPFLMYPAPELLLTFWFVHVSVALSPMSYVAIRGRLVRVPPKVTVTVFPLETVTLPTVEVAKVSVELSVNKTLLPLPQAVVKGPLPEDPQLEAVQLPEVPLVFQ